MYRCGFAFPKIGELMMLSANYGKILVTVSSFVPMLICDIVSKYLVVMHIEEHERINIIGPFVQFTKLYNQGAIFGIKQGYQKFFMILSIVVLVVLICFYVYELMRKATDYLFCVAMGLIFSGAVGNIIDRAIGRPGVVDFIYIGINEKIKWYVFNIADSAIVVGAILLALSLYRQEKKSKSISIE
jgi:signal peptidase II